MEQTQMNDMGDLGSSFDSFIERSFDGKDSRDPLLPTMKREPSMTAAARSTSRKEALDNALLEGRIAPNEPIQGG